MEYRLDASRHGRVYDMTSDGNRALVGTTERADPDTETRPRITVQTNWFEQLERRVK